MVQVELWLIIINQPTKGEKCVFYFIGSEAQVFNQNMFCDLDILLYESNVLLSH